MIQQAAPWRRFLALLLGIGLGAGLVVYLFVVIVDPWGVLPLAPPLSRVPISSNARFSFPALARSAAFDSAIIGTSTFRLLQPAALNARLGTRFVNLSMNAATPYEQSQLLQLFLRHHAAPRLLLIGVDSGWCAPAPYRLTPRPFPAWMYGGPPWRGYFEMFNLFAVQEAGKQLGVMLGLKRPPYGADGYTSFLPPDSAYDPARARQHLVEDRAPAVPADPHTLQTLFPALAMLREALDQAPAATGILLSFAPYYIDLQGAPGTQAAADLAECKQRVTALVRTRPHTLLIDFMIPSAITTVAENYWDPRHYRSAVAARLTEDIAAAVQGRAPMPGDAAVVTGPD